MLYEVITRLKQLPVTAVKIDRSFVHDITDDEGAVPAARMTSYNVCYTKLLRPGHPILNVPPTSQTVAKPAPAGPQAAVSCYHGFTHESFRAHQPDRFRHPVVDP